MVINITCTKLSGSVFKPFRYLNGLCTVDILKFVRSVLLLFFLGSTSLTSALQTVNTVYVEYGNFSVIVKTR